MRIMIDLANQRGPLHIIDASTDVDCTKDVRFGLGRRSFRFLVDCMAPCCGLHPSPPGSPEPDTYPAPSSATVTGTFFGYRRGRVSFCLQDASRSAPLLLLEFAVQTAYLAREMQHGLLRIALESDRVAARSAGSLFSVPVWSMYCNGRKVGFAVRRQVTGADVAVLRLMRSVSAGAGVLPGQAKSGDGDLMYMRASFERVIGSAHSESFHMINPVGSTGQELSIFLLRS